MLTLPWLPLFSGFILTGILVAFSDFRNRQVNDLSFLPAIIGAAIFYATSSLLVILLTAIMSVVLFAVSLGTFRLFKKRMGGADRIELGVVSLWPTVFVFAVTFGSLAGFILGKKGKWLHVPFAGLIALFSFLAMLYVAL